MAKLTPKLSVIERRLQSVFGEPSSPIRFKEKGLIARWFNTQARPDNIWRAKELGWQGVTEDMIAEPDQIGHHTKSPEGYIARGERAGEILMYMREEDYQKIQLAKTAENLKRMRVGAAQKREIVEELGKEDPQGAEFLHRHLREGVGPTGYVKDGIERIPIAAREEGTD